jgi:hypothetical protein
VTESEGNQNNKPREKAHSWTVAASGVGVIRDVRKLAITRMYKDVSKSFQTES